MENSDGSPLTDLAGFRLYWGTSPSDLDNSVTLDPGTMIYVIDELTLGTWYFAATSFNVNNRESEFSNIASKTIM